MPPLSLRWQAWLARQQRPSAREPPLRGELYGAARLAQHAVAVAAGHRAILLRRPTRLLARLDENEKILRAFNRASKSISRQQTRQLTPAAEWLLDNGYLIEEQIHMARRHLPRGYSSELPRLLHGPSAELPRVYDLALELISHVDAQIDALPLTAFVAAYQTVTSLSLGELWAIPIMLRLGLIENLQRIATRLTVARLDRDLADEWVERLHDMAQQDPSHLVVVVADMAESELPLSSGFVAQFCQGLSRQNPVLHLARGWLEERLALQGLTIEQLVHLESRSQAADQVSVSHSIASLRLLSAMNWKDFVESLSVVESTLRGDPAGVYAAMDFPTRDRYRHGVEAIARHSRWSETEVAQRAVGLAAAAATKLGLRDRTAHVGYFLIEQGRAELERVASVGWRWRGCWERQVHRCPLVFYLGGILAFSLLVTFGYREYLLSLELSAGWANGLALVMAVCASQLGVGLTNWLATLLVKPRLLPRLDFSAGIAVECRTMVAVPALLTSVDGVDQLLETLEIHQLANRDPRLHFALLTDFRDAMTETEPDDALLLARIGAGIEALNRRYPAAEYDRFYLFHRARRWNDGEGRWMGYERKRGKLAEFNGLLRGQAIGCFSVLLGDLAVLPAVKYVITLDSDTQLPRDSAFQLVGTMAHPLNQPQFDPARGVVVAGYGILQPRVGVSLPGAGRSWFVRLFAGDAGIDPYTRAVSDVYQDVFREGSFIGKGIYDVDAFTRALGGRCPENAILSHDLLEACHARSALVSDIELFEEYPSHYNVDIGRRHRWIRGDWQISPWLLPRVPGPDARRVANPLSTLSQWKIFDNLRRSLVPVALLLLWLGQWGLLSTAAGAGTLSLLLLMALPGLLAALVNLLRKPSDQRWGLHLRNALEAGGRQVGQVFFAIVFLPYDAFISLDAIGRTLVRLCLTRKRLMEWQTSNETGRNASIRLVGFYATMWIAPLVAVTTGAALWLLSPGSLPFALPILGTWFLAPTLAWWISQPISTPVPRLSPEQRAFLGRTARKTWHYFETFVTPEENWLPPDNFQEVPQPTVAARTSPTNIGLALLANLAAYDFGYLTLGGLVQRTGDTLATLQRLRRHRGHFFNWYDTRTLQPLLPLYVSSVDSGNLAGHLLTLGAGLRELADAPVFRPQVFAGIRDTLGILKFALGDPATLGPLDLELARGPVSLPAARTVLERVATAAGQIAGSMPDPGDEARGWAGRLRQHCEEQGAELAWLAGLQGGRAELPDSTFPGTATLRECAGQGPTAPVNEAAPIPGNEAAALARSHLAALETLAGLCETLAAEMEFGFLFDPVRDLFTIGFNATDHRRDPGFFDLLASESRLGSYVAISLGQVPQDHWFSLGRLLVATGGEPLLVSWSGSMFEYLMPLLVMPRYENTLLDRTCQVAVRRQIRYGAARGVPWGISESGYYHTDGHLNYQYRAFGVPGLGLKRGLADDLVIAPYATAMALVIAPLAACENLQRLAADGREGDYGFYEAIDYTPSRLPPGEASAPVRSFMAHHQGMSLLALVSLLREEPMQRRFLACPLLRATDLLLQERVPKAAPTVFSDELDLDEPRDPLAGFGTGARTLTHPNPPTPEVHLLSNGRYHVVLTSAGGGYSRRGELALTRWREDATSDCWGTWIYLRDLGSQDLWSAAYQPTRRAQKHFEAVFCSGRAEFRHRHAGLGVHTEICVSPEDDVELRRVTLYNRSAVVRVIEITSYAEIVLAPAAAEAAHPAFSGLFVQTEWVSEPATLLCTRRARSATEATPWLLQMMVGTGGEQGELSVETDRARFLGRGGSIARPAALDVAGPLSNTVGAVLDPIVAFRRQVTLPPNGTAVVTLIMGVADSRAAALALADKYRQPRMDERAFELAWTHGQVTLRQLNVTAVEAQLYSRLASALIFADSFHRALPGVLSSNRRGQNGLWSHAISGDLPLVLLRLRDPAKTELARQLIQAHAYWRMKGLAVDLVILNEDTSVYRQSLQDELTRLIRSGLEAQMLDQPGGIFVRRLEHVAPEDRILFQTVARIVFSDEDGTLADQMAQPRVGTVPVPDMVTHSARAASEALLPVRDLIFENGLGGFTRDGREYVITLRPGQFTPAPWVNVIANPTFGTLVSETGGGYTWLDNAHEFRLTPWNNDSVQDPPGEALYVRDERTGQFWSPTPGPARGLTPYVIRHGFGYTVFEHTENGIASELWIYVAMDAPVKLVVLKLRNVSGRPRRLSVTGYWEWVLGDLRPKCLMHVQTELDPKTGALLVRNRYHPEFSERIVFLDVNETARSVTGDRKEFLGRNGTLRHPAAMARTRLSGKVGAGLDPCGALQVALELADGAEYETSFRLGAGRDADEVQSLIDRFRQPEAGRRALEGVWAHWNRTLGAVTVETPDAAVNVLANGWLLYQTLSCRLWGRTGHYQSGGAYGFRDQLQDVMALIHAAPGLAREHLLRAASRQFREGDVQHWWHPPVGRGVRTHSSDDYLWLPLVTCRYVDAVNDFAILDEKISWLDGRALKRDEESYYDLPTQTETSGTLYDHCVAALEHGLKFGVHGLPLIGAGDWNDGLNLVGPEGRGESVWLGFFLYDVLTQFGALARSRADHAVADRCLTQAALLRQNLELHTWDGAWYRRAYFDNGEPLGSQSNQECQIDSLPQSWSVLSRAGDPARARQAMESVDQRLVRRQDGLIQLFDPPFDHSSQNPGYIKGYIPGVRENGGQYTHGAIWTVMAFAQLGQTDKAWELFNLLNPIHHSATPAQAATYKVEPYVVAADVYAVPPHTGRGGWTWYTGSAGWMYQALTKTLLGLHREGNHLRLVPRMPRAWNSYKIHYRFHQTVHHIMIIRRQAEFSGQPALTLDGQPREGNRVPLQTDGQEHTIVMVVD